MRACYDEDIARIIESFGPEPHPAQVAMAEEAAETGFPIVGRAVGGFLAVSASLADARCIFEFGSGFGYSASWFARGLRDDGTVILTEIDADELERARDYLAEMDVADRATFEHGDAIEIVESHDGPFDVVLIDNENTRYVEAFEAARERIRPGGFVVADNMLMALGGFQTEELRSVLDGTGEENAHARGIAQYLEHVRGEAAFDTALLPLGEGLAVSVKRR